MFAKSILWLALGAAPLLFTGCFTGVDSEFIALRNEALPTGSVHYEKQFQHKIGGLMLNLASKFVDDEDPDVGALISELKMVQIGIYELTEPYDQRPQLEQAKSIRDRMAKRNRYPVVWARDAEQIVGVYAPTEDFDSLRELIVCVLSRDEVVLVQITGKLDDLATVIARRETELGLL